MNILESIGLFTLGFFAFLTLIIVGFVVKDRWVDWWRDQMYEVVKTFREARRFEEALKNVPTFPPPHAGFPTPPDLRETTMGKTAELVEKNRRIAETMTRGMKENWSTEKLRQAMEEIMGVPVTGTIMGFPVVESESLREWTAEERSRMDLVESLDRAEDPWERAFGLSVDDPVGRLLFDLEVDGRAILKKEKGG